MQDYTYQSVLFAYLLFVIFFGLAAYFLIRSLKDGYFGKNSEEPKYRMLQDDFPNSAPDTHTHSTGATAQLK